MKALLRISKALFSKNPNYNFNKSLKKVKEADQVTETIDKRLEEIEKKLKLKSH